MPDLRWPTYKSQPFALASTIDDPSGGLWVQDDAGRRYLDAVNGIGCAPLGHGHPRWVEAITAQARTLSASSNGFVTAPQQALARALGERAGISDARVFLCNTGTEATEAAVKLALVATGRDVIIAFDRAFHGRTFAALSLTANPSYRAPFIADLDAPREDRFARMHVVRVPFLDVPACEAAFGRFPGRIAAVFVESIQGEAGVYPATREQLLSLSALCRREGALLGVDEVQAGAGRTGAWTGWQSIVGDAAQPDLLWLAKALGGGYPIGACVARAELAARMSVGSHGTTFGGNPIACAAALATFDIIESEGLLEAAARQIGTLREIAGASPIAAVSEIRGCGAMIGIQIGAPAERRAEALGLRLAASGLLATICGGHTVRLLLPYRAGASELEHAWRALARAIEGDDA